MAYRHTRNITRIARLAIAAGDLSEWYSDAWQTCVDIDPSNPRRAAAVIAVLSPMSAWHVNVRNARLAYSYADNGRLMEEWHNDAPCLKANALKAWHILHEPHNFEKFVSGPKVSAFYHNICGDYSQVTIDRHAIDIAYGKPLSDKQRANAISRKADRESLIDSYTRAGRILGFTPAQIQAITWVFWRSNYSYRRAADVRNNPKARNNGTNKAGRV